MNQFINIILIVLISAVVCAAMLFAVNVLDLGETSNSDQVAELEKQIQDLKTLIKSMNNGESGVKDDSLKNYIDEMESKFKLSSTKYDADEFEALENRINQLEKKNQPKSQNLDFEEFVKSDAYKQMLKDQLKEFYENAKDKQKEQAKSKEFDKIYGKFKEELIKLAKKLGVSDADVEKILGIGEEYIDQLLAFKEDYDGKKDNLSAEERQEYLLKQTELERSQFYAKIRESVGDNTFMKLRTESRKREDLKKLEPIAQKLNLEDWQKAKIDEALNRHYEQTKYIDMVMKTEKLDLNNATEYQKQIEDSWKMFSNELLNSVLNEEQRKLAMNK